MKRFYRIRMVFFTFVTHYLIWCNNRFALSGTVGEIVRLNITNAYLDVKINDTIFIKCMGSPPLNWTHNHPLGHDIHDEVDQSIIRNSFGNESINKITFKSEDATGRYTCQNENNNSSVYIFVSDCQKTGCTLSFGDGDKLLINDFHTLLEVGKRNFIPCFTTISNATVTLWKMQGSTRTQVLLDFDPMSGFIIDIVPENMTGDFLCVAEYENKLQEEMIEMDRHEASESIPQVFINNTNATFVMVGSDFSLECFIRTEIGVFYQSNWDYPSKPTTRASETQKHFRDTYMTEKIILSISNATKGDEGSYRCSALDSSRRTNFAEVPVTIYDTLPKYNFSFITEKERIIKSRHQNIKLLASYVVFPPLTNVLAIWKKDGRPIEHNFRHTPHHEPLKHEFSLKIPNLSWKDSGLYTIVTNISGELKQKSFYLQVEDIPIVNVSMNSACCYFPDKKYILYCNISGYPLSDTIMWAWKPLCLNTTSQCETYFEAGKWISFDKHYEVNNSTVEVIKKNSNVISNLKVEAAVSGYYRCTARNKYGSSEAEFMFIVSDVEEGFDIVSENTIPEVNSYFNAVCKASLVLYSDLQWKWISEFNNQSMNFPAIKPVYSTLSFSLPLEMENISENYSGVYVCMATSRNNGEIQEKSLTVSVRGVTSLTSEKRDEGLNTKTILIPALFGIFLIILTVGYVVKICYFDKKNKLVLQNFNNDFLQGHMAIFDSNLPLDEQVDLLPYDEQWEFPREKLKLGKTLGQGAFGRVVKAEAVGITEYETVTSVAVKMLKERADINQQKSLMDELKILIHLGHHANIVNLMGAVTQNIQKDGLMVIVEFCRYGNIRHYLHRHRDTFVNEIHPDTGKIFPTTDIFFSENESLFQDFNSELRQNSTSSSPGVFTVHNPNYRRTRGRSSVCSNPRGSAVSQTVQYSGGSSTSSGSVFRNYYRTDSQENIITTSDLLCFAFQCARGMDYLASKKLIHRDLAARNVLLADDKIVKICDFGLAKDCYKYSNYVKKGDGPLPIKWMSIESIWDHVFTTKSDVWSFGILMWELFTLGGNPYPGVDINEQFYKSLKAGYRMEKPELCPNFAYQIMRDCWNAEPDKRPHFDEISEMIGDCLDESVKQHYIDVNEPYMEMNNKMKAPHYSNVERSTNGEIQNLYVNSKALEDSLQYDVPIVCRSIYNEPVPAEAMEVVPMIQLESYTNTTELQETKNKCSGHLQVQGENTIDYLQMKMSHEKT